MSEFINNKEFRQQKLKELIKRLHDGASVEDVQEEFNKLTSGVNAKEITEMEQALVDEGMPVEDIQKLCDVHASVFKGLIEDIHKEEGYVKEELEIGHPVSTFKEENWAIETLLDNEVLEHLSNFQEYQSERNKELLLQSFKQLATIDKHYSRKENLIFPYMEKYDITAPPQVMWGVDDEIRGKIKAVLATLSDGFIDIQKISVDVEDVVHQVKEMIFKEDEIMFPMVLDTFTHDEWVEIEQASEEIGYTLLESVNKWKTTSINKEVDEDQQVAEAKNIGKVGRNSKTEILFDAGSLTAEDVNAILNTVPLDMTFVGADGKVKYFTQGTERVFDRPLTIIGREVKNCHPPKSVHIVEEIIEDIKSGKKDHEDFWLRMGDMFVYIRYFAVRNKQGEYLGILEVTQNIKEITELEGEKRLV